MRLKGFVCLDIQVTYAAEAHFLLIPQSSSTFDENFVLIWDMLESNYLGWVLIGIGLMILEVFSGTFYLLFVGFAALLTAAVSYLFGPVDWSIEAGLFAVLSIVLALIVKKKQFHKTTVKDFQIDDKNLLIASDNLAPGESKTIIYQGSPWAAENISDFPIQKGQQIQIQRMESIRLLVVPKEEK